MTIDSSLDRAFAGAVAALPAPRPPADAHEPLTTAVPAWHAHVAVLAGLLGGALMVAGVLMPW